MQLSDSKQFDKSEVNPSSCASHATTELPKDNPALLDEITKKVTVPF